MTMIYEEGGRWSGTVVQSRNTQVGEFKYKWTFRCMVSCKVPEIREVES